MAHGKIRVNTLSYDTGSGDVDIAVSGIPTAADLNAKADASALTAKADLDSPTLTGTPAAPTAASGTNTTQIATTAFVTAAVPDISGKADTADIGTTIQAYDADTAKTDVAQTFTAAQRGYINSYGNTSGTPTAMDFDVSNSFSFTLTGNITISNPTNLYNGQTGSIFLQQDGTGSRTASWGSYWDFAGGVAPVLSTQANAVDRIDYVVRSSTSIHAVATLNYS